MCFLHVDTSRPTSGKSRRTSHFVRTSDSRRSGRGSGGVGLRGGTSDWEVH